jgi:hypothetical protein
MTLLAIDYDGVIVTDGHWPDPGEPIPGAVDAINLLHNAGYCIIINSCRVGQAEQAMKTTLAKLGLKFCRINDNCPERIKRYETDCRKISADVYIDDRSLFNPLKHLSWPELADFILLEYPCSSRMCEEVL